MILRRALYALAVLSIPGLLCQCGIVDRDDKEVPDIDAGIQDQMEALRIPSIAAVITSGGEIVWEGAYGYADVERGLPATGNTVYTLMSVSKTVIVTAAMQLWERGLLELDEDINQYLPFSVRNPRYRDSRITARMLMTHTSGLAHPDDEVPGWYQMYGDDQTPRMSESIDQWILPGGSHYVAAVWKDWAPGTRELYSNIGTWLLAYLVERISGEEFTAYCENHIFAPLKMGDTSYWLRDLESRDLASPYVDDYHAIAHYNTVAYPVGWLRSSAHDLAHLLLAYMNEGVYDGARILSSDAIDKTLEVQNPASGVCLIWYKWLGEWYGHDGAGTGFSSRVEFNREDKTGIIILANLQTDAIHPGGRIFELIRLEANRYR
jgi:CubicO group peptidase (beta-lactamase class C family)